MAFPYIAQRGFILMVAGAKAGLGMSFSARHLVIALIGYQSSATMLSAFLILSFDSSSNLRLAANPMP